MWRDGGGKPRSRKSRLVCRNFWGKPPGGAAECTCGTEPTAELGHGRGYIITARPRRSLAPAAAIKQHPPLGSIGAHDRETRQNRLPGIPEIARRQYHLHRIPAWKRTRSSDGLGLKDAAIEPLVIGAHHRQPVSYTHLRAHETDSYLV